MQAMRKLIHEYQYVRVAIGITGNICFLAGEVLFLYKHLPAAV